MLNCEVEGRGFKIRLVHYSAVTAVLNPNWQAVSPALQQLLAILTALDLPQPTKDTTVFELFSNIEAKVSQSLHFMILIYPLWFNFFFFGLKMFRAV